MLKILPANAGNVGSVPQLGRFSGEGNGNPLQYSYQGNFLYRGAWWPTIHGIAKESDTTERLNNKRLNIVPVVYSSPFFFTLYRVVCICWASQMMLGVKNIPATEGYIRNAGSIPGSGRAPGEKHGNPLQHSS